MDHKDLSAATCLKDLDSTLLNLTTLALLQMAATIFDGWFFGTVWYLGGVWSDLVKSDI